jgi:chorismate mutase
MLPARRAGAGVRRTMFAIRGAVQVERDSPAAIAAAVARLCKEIARANRLSAEKIVSAIFTVTPDLASAFPARAAREQGWSAVPMLCAQEIPVPGAPQRICRALVHARGRRKPRHIYLGRAGVLLRPDLPAEPRSAARRKTPSPRPSPRGRGSRERRSSHA